MEIVKALGWPHFTFLFCVVFILLFRKPLFALISRITSIDKSGIKASQSPEVQREEQKKEAGWSLDQYLGFLLGRSLITTKGNVYHITNLGVEYLTWMTRNGKGEDKPL